MNLQPEAMENSQHFAGKQLTKSNRRTFKVYSLKYLVLSIQKLCLDFTVLCARLLAGSGNFLTIAAWKEMCCFFKMSACSFNISSTHLHLQMTLQLCKMTLIPHLHPTLPLFLLIDLDCTLSDSSRWRDGWLIQMSSGGIPPTWSLRSSNSWKKMLQRVDRIPAIPLYTNPSSIRLTSSLSFYLSLHVSLSVSLPPYLLISLQSCLCLDCYLLRS